MLATLLLLGCFTSMWSCKKNGNDGKGENEGNNNTSGEITDNNNNTDGSNDKDGSDNDDGGEGDDENRNEQSEFEGPLVVYVEMDFGEFGKIVIEVDRLSATITADNFIDLVENGFYDGLTIFRAQQKFVIQGGKNESVKLNPIKGEFEENNHKNDISHTRGVISMARTSDPDSATSQFFITLDDSAAYSLDGSYAGFGHVIEGMDVVDKIAGALYAHAVDSMGFVNDKDAIKIVSAKIIER